MSAPDITGWSEARIQAWEATHEMFATDERADAAADAAAPSAVDIAESERWRDYYDAEADR